MLAQGICLEAPPDVGSEVSGVAEWGRSYVTEVFFAGSIASTKHPEMSMTQQRIRRRRLREHDFSELFLLVGLRSLPLPQINPHMKSHPIR